MSATRSRDPEVYVTRRPAAVPHPTRAEECDALSLLRDDLVDRIRTDEDLERALRAFADRSTAPHAELVRRLLGLELTEAEAAALTKRIVGHRRELSRTLDRPVHVRVAALDLLTLAAPPGTKKIDSRPLKVTSSSLFQKAIEEATADGVTGLPQRAHFMSLLRHELRQRRRRGIVCVYVDLDGFKRVNDEHGHARGDDVLRSFARIGAAVLRQGDVIARIGGDEFALLLVDVSIEEAESISMRLRERFEELVTPLAVSFSVGLAAAEPDETAEDILGRADRAMYADKRSRTPR